MTRGGVAGSTSVPHRILSYAANTCGVVAGALLVYVAVASGLAITLREVFGSPSRFLFDSAEMAMALTVYTAIPFVAYHGGHVRVDLVPSRFGTTNRVLLRLSSALQGLGALFLAYIAFGQYRRDWGTGIPVSSTYGLPRWIPMLVLTVGLTIYGVIQLLAAYRGRDEAVQAVPKEPIQ